MARRVRISELREALTVVELQTTDAGGGVSTSAPVVLGTVRGRVRALRSREYEQTRQVLGATVYEITVRWPLAAGVTITSRSQLVWSSPTGSRTLEASAPPTFDDRNRFLSILCTEKEST